MSDEQFLAMSFSELADLYVALVAQNERQRREIARLEAENRALVGVAYDAMNNLTGHPDRVIRAK